MVAEARGEKREGEREADGSDMVRSEKDIWSTTAHVEKKPEARGKGAEQGCFEHLQGTGLLTPQPILDTGSTMKISEGS